MRTPHPRNRYEINDAFFDAWSPTMAYVLGFWFADGFMRHEKSYRIVFVSRDRDAICDVRVALGATHPVRQRRSDRTWNIILFSKRMYERLQKLGGYRRKSRTVQFPKVPAHYLPDFIRGYFDGDGSVFIVRYISTKNHKPRVELRSNFTSGSRSFLENLMQILHKKAGLAVKRIGSYNNGHSLKLGYGMKDTCKPLRFIYYPKCPLALARKRYFVEDNFKRLSRVPTVAADYKMGQQVILR